MTAYEQYVQIRDNLYYDPRNIVLADAIQERKRDTWGRFISPDDKYAIQGLAFKQPKLPEKKSEPELILKRANYMDCCAVTILHNFYDSYHSPSIRRTGVTKEQHMKHNVEVCVSNAKRGSYGLIMATISKSQKDWGWGQALEDAGFTLVSAVNNPQHQNRSRVYSYQLLIGSQPESYVKAA